MKRIILSMMCISLIFVSCVKKDTQDTPNHRLLQAANDGDVKALQASISDGADVNFMDSETAMIAAAHKGHTEVVKILLEKGADVNAKTADGRTALWIASYFEHVEVVKLLLSAKVDVNAGVIIEGQDFTPLAIAKQKGNTQIVELLKKAGAKE